MLYARNVAGATQIDGSTYLLMHREKGVMRCGIRHPDSGGNYCTYGDVTVAADGDDVPLLALRAVNPQIWCSVMGIRRNQDSWTFRVVAVRGYNTGVADIRQEDIQWWSVGRPYLTQTCNVLLRDRATRRLLYTNAAPIARMLQMIPEESSAAVPAGRTYAVIYNGRIVPREQSQTDEEGNVITSWSVGQFVAGRSGAEILVTERIINGGVSGGGNGPGTAWGSGGEALEGWGSGSGALVLDVTGI